MPPGLGYPPKMKMPGQPDEQQMLGEVLFSEMQGGPQNQTQPVGAPQKIAEPPLPEAPAAPKRTGFGGMSLESAGNQNPMGFTGFNLDRAFKGGDANSVKDGFARTVGGLNLDVRGMDKAGVGQALASTVIPALQANGIQARPGASPDVIEVFSAERGWEPIDVVKNAGAGNAEWAWQDLMGQGGAPAPQAAQAAQAGLGGMGAALGDDQTLAAILAQIQQLIDPAQQEALLGGALFEQFGQERI